MLISQKAFEDWFTRAVGSSVAASTWLSILAKREANFLQDYLVTLHLNLEQIPSKEYLTVGTLIRQDFVNISARLERAAFTFFERDVRQLKLSDLDKYHKYPREYTEQRLKETQLFSRWSEVNQLANTSDESDVS